MEGMEEDEDGEQGDAAAAAAAGVGVGVAGGEGDQGGQVTVELTEEENAAVENVRDEPLLWRVLCNTTSGVPQTCENAFPRGVSSALFCGGRFWG